MCESCQRPASNGIIVPRDSGPLTTSALEKSQKQTAQCKQEQPGAAVLGQSSQVRAPAAPGPLQAPSRPQHDPPRRSGTVGASLSPSSIARPPGPRCCSVSGQPCKGASRSSGNRSLLGCFPCTQLEQFAGAQRAGSLTRSECSVRETVWVCKSGSRFWETSRCNLPRGAVGESQTRGKWEPAWAPSVAAHCELCPPAAARHFVYYLGDKGFLQEGWVFQPSVR